MNTLFISIFLFIMASHFSIVKADESNPPASEQRNVTHSDIHSSSQDSFNDPMVEAESSYEYKSYHERQEETFWDRTYDIN